MSSKHVLVTGGGRGIGRSVVETLVNHGFRVSFTYREQTEAAQRVECICRDRGDVKAYQLDQARHQEIESRLETLMEERGPVDCLVNNASILKEGHLVMQNMSAWQELMDVNLTGTVTLTRGVLRPMLHRRSGRIVNVVSASGLTGLPGQTAYSASKGAVISFTKALALEVAKFNVLVNAVAPGLIQTEMIQNLSPAKVENHLKNVPLGRLGQPDEVANVVNFLLSEACQYMTGQVLRVDGGLVMA